MKKFLIAAVAASGCLIGLQASAFAQSGPFAFNGADTAALNAYYNGYAEPQYWDYAGPNVQPQARVLHRHNDR